MKYHRKIKTQSGFFGSISPRDFRRFAPSNILDRASPLEIILLIVLIMIIVGGAVSILRGILWVGLLIFSVYFIFFLIWLYKFFH